LTIAELDRMSQIEIDTADKTKLVDIQTIKIDPLQSAAQRMENYLEQIKNPYLFLCGETAVRIRFEPEEKSLVNKLKNYFISIKKC
jgi:hypothetical protein